MSGEAVVKIWPPELAENLALAERFRYTFRVVGGWLVCEEHIDMLKMRKYNAYEVAHMPEVIRLAYDVKSNET